MGSPRNRKKPQKPAGSQGSGKGKAWREGTAGSGNVLHASRDTGGLEASHGQGPPTSTPGQETTAGLQHEGRERGQARGEVAQRRRRARARAQGKTGKREPRASGLSVGPLPSIPATPERLRWQP